MIKATGYATKITTLSHLITSKRSAVHVEDITAQVTCSSEYARHNFVLLLLN